MKIHSYKVFEQGPVALTDILNHLQGISLAQRLRNVSGAQIRLEAVQSTGSIWLLDFGGIRHDGPGRASANQPIEDFDLQAHEGFGHETAACFDGEFLILQYNHFGPRISRIREYLSQIGQQLAGPAGAGQGQVINFITVLKGDALDRLGRMGLVKSMEFSFYVPGVAAANDGAARPSLSGLLSNPLIGTAAKVRVQVSAARDRTSSLVINHVQQAIDDLIGVRDEVSELQIVAKEAEDSPREQVDFLDARLEADIPVQRTGRRYGRAERWVALRQALDTWRANGQLK